MSALVDLDTERRLVSAAIYDPSWALTCGAHPHELSSPAHRDVYAAVLALAERGAKVDTAALSAELTKRGQSARITALLELGNRTELPSPTYAPRLRSLAQGRAAKEAALRAIATLEAGQIEDGLACLVSAAEEVRPPEASDTTSVDIRALIEHGVMSVLERNERREAGLHVTITTGCHALDVIIGDSPDGQTLAGWEPGDCIVVGGSTNVGKTSFALDCAFAQARSGARVGIVSVEDGMRRMALRMLSMHTRIPQHALRSGLLSRGQWDLLTRSSIELASLPMRFEFEVAANLHSVTAAIRRLVREHRCQCVYVDYVQAIKDDGRQDTRLAIRDAVAECKRAVSIGVAEPAALVMLSQVKRLPGDTNKPTIKDLYESGYIEQKADSIVLLWKDDSHTLNGCLAKTKDGRVGAEWQMERGASGMLTDGKGA